MPDLNHVVWIGGPPGAGKTTIARRLARKYGARLYSADTRTWQHRDRALAMGIVAAHEWERRRPTWDWDDAGDDDLLAMSLHDVRGPMVLEDIAALPTRPLIVAEGTVLPAGTAPPHALWLLPRERTADDRLTRVLTARIEEEARTNIVPTLTTEPARAIEATVALVEAHFAGALASAPLACTREERAALLREYNQSIVAQVRGYYGRPWATGTAESVTRRFVCECGREECIEEVECTVAEAASEPVSARHTSAGE